MTKQHADDLSGQRDRLLARIEDLSTRYGMAHVLLSEFPKQGYRDYASLLIASNWPNALLHRFLDGGGITEGMLVAQLEHSLIPVCVPVEGLFGRANSTRDSALLPVMRNEGFETCFVLRLALSGSKEMLILLAGQRPLPDRREQAELLFLLLELVGGSATVSEARPTLAKALSQRELECLRWAAAGKSSDEIGMILSISVHTVNGYLKVAVRKLDTVNRMQAIARAIRLGIL